MSGGFCLPLYVGRGVTDSHPTLSKRVSDIDELANFIKEYAGIAKGEWYWLTGDLKNGHRCADEVERVHALIIDIDDGMTIEEATARVDELGLLCLFYASASHQQIKPGKVPKAPCDRFRLIFPFATPVKGTAWVYMYGPLCDYILGRENAFDPACKDPSRLWYAAQSPDLVQVLCRGGKLLDASCVKPLPKDLPRKKDAAPTSRGDHLSDRPGDDFAAQHSWQDLLERIGCKFLRSKGGEEFYEGAHKDKGEISVTANYGGSDVLYVFSSSMAPLKPQTSYTKFGFYAEIWHGGDHVAAARQLGKDGYGKSIQRHQPYMSPANHEHTDDRTVEIFNEGHTPYEGEKRHKLDASDVGNAERFVRIYGQDFRHCHRFGSWLHWKKAWMMDQMGGAVAMQKMIQMVRGIAKEGFDIRDADIQKTWLSWAGKCMAIAPRNNALIDASKIEGVACEPDDFDKDPYLLNLRNGTLDLRTMELREHRREDMITKIIDIAYDPKAECPFWLEFLSKVLDHDDDLIRYVQKACGYSLSGDTSEKCFFFLYGSGNNGKSIFIETITKVMGPYANQLDIEALMLQSTAGSGPTNDLAALKGARFVVSSETEDGRRLSESKIKRLTGGDTIRCRFLNKEFFSYVPELKMWIAGNHKPVIRGTDEGIWSRVHLIPFEVCIPKEQRIPAAEMHRRFKAQLPGILAWMIEGHRLWKAEGLKRPKAVEQAVETYRDDSDTFGTFLEECTDTDQFGEGVKAADLYNSYTRWSKRQGEKAPQTMQKFGRAMSDRGEPSKKTNEGKIYTQRVLKEEPAQQAMYWQD